jgi:hypothetical protein
MSTLDFHVFDLDFPVGSRNKTATHAMLVDAGIRCVVAGFSTCIGRRLYSTRATEASRYGLPCGPALPAQ